MTDSNAFKQWCVVELFGHNLIAGLVSEQQIGGQAFVRVDVPKADDRDGYTKLYGAGAIYAITPVDEETCMKMVRNMTSAPIQPYHFRETVPQLAERQPPLFGHDNDDEDDFDR